MYDLEKPAFVLTYMYVCFTHPLSDGLMEVGPYVKITLKRVPQREPHWLLRGHMSSNSKTFSRQVSERTTLQNL